MCSPGIVLIFVNIALYAFCFQMQTPVQPKLLRELGVDSEPSDMTFSLSLGGGRWSGVPAGGSRASWRSPATPSGPGSGE